MSFYESDTSSPDNLIAGSFPREKVEVVIVAGEGELPRGSVIAKITSGDNTGKYALINSTGTDDGRRAATYAMVLEENIDATDADVTTIADDTGDFNENALTFGGNDTADTHKVALTAKHIYLHSSVEAV